MLSEHGRREPSSSTLKVSAGPTTQRALSACIEEARVSIIGITTIVECRVPIIGSTSIVKCRVSIIGI